MLDAPNAPNLTNLSRHTSMKGFNEADWLIRVYRLQRPSSPRFPILGFVFILLLPSLASFTNRIDTSGGAKGLNHVLKISSTEFHETKDTTCNIFQLLFPTHIFLVVPLLPLRQENERYITLESLLISLSRSCHGEGKFVARILAFSSPRKVGF